MLSSPALNRNEKELALRNRRANRCPLGALVLVHTNRVRQRPSFPVWRLPQPRPPRASQGIMSFFQSREKQLNNASNLWVLLLLLSHCLLPVEYVWTIAATFSVVMNFPYVIEAFACGSFLRQEVATAASLIILSILGAALYPPLVIAAWFGHGAWDLAKHRGVGVAFFSWYTLPCAVFDSTYACLLVIFWNVAVKV